MFEGGTFREIKGVALGWVVIVERSFRLFFSAKWGY